MSFSDSFREFCLKIIVFYNLKGIQCNSFYVNYHNVSELDGKTGSSYI